MPLVTDPIDWLIDPVTGDLVITDDIQLVYGLDAVVQIISIAIQMFAGEWFLDEATGVRYYQDLLGHKYDDVTARAAFRDLLLSLSEVKSIASLSTSFDALTRKLTVTYEVLTEFGAVASSVELGV